MKDRKGKLVCGFEKTCGEDSCLNCRKTVSLYGKRIPLSVAVSLEDFLMSDLSDMSKEDLRLRREILRVLFNDIKWR